MVSQNHAHHDGSRHGTHTSGGSQTPAPFRKRLALAPMSLWLAWDASDTLEADLTRHDTTRHGTGCTSRNTRHGHGNVRAAFVDTALFVSSASLCANFVASDVLAVCWHGPSHPTKMVGNKRQREWEFGYIDGCICPP